MSIKIRRLGDVVIALDNSINCLEENEFLIWLANDHYYEGNIFLNSYPFIDEDEEHDQDNHNNIDDDKDQDDYSIHKLEHNLIDLYRQYEELMSNSPKGYDRSHEREVNRLEERMSDLEEELFRPHSKK